MADIVLFQSRRDIDVSANLLSFIQLCRDQLTVFGADLGFDGMDWDVTAFIPLPGKTGKLRAIFSSWETRNAKQPGPMPEPFAAFGKGYFRYQHSMRPTKAIGQRISALRALCAALAESGQTSPVDVDAGILNRAAQLIGGEFGDATAYRTGGQLQLLAEFMDDHHICRVPLQWKNPLARPQETTGRVGEEFDARRQDKLPSVEVLDALTRAYRAASEPRDVLLTSIVALLCASPDRIGEVLRLPADCEVRQDRPGKPTAYGLRYWASKGADPMVKWVITSMTGVVAEAVDRIRQHTAEARRVAKWYEDNPTDLYLPSHLEHLRSKEWLTMSEAGQVVFVDAASRTTSAVWVKSGKVETKTDPRHPRWLLVSFKSLERCIVGMLPRGFPVLDAETGLKYSEALCVVVRNSLHATKSAYWGVIDAIGDGTIAQGLGSTEVHESVFDRLGLTDASGARLKVRSHQFRHYLNTLAQAGGLSELDIAKWSGRVDVRHNAAYNHVSDRDVQAKLTQLRAESNEPATQIAVQTRANLIPRAKFAELGVQAAHTTEFGFCAHDFAMSPCQLHLDCANCNEQVCVKGDQYGEANARVMLEETGELLAEAKAASKDGAYGTSPWVHHQQVTFDRLSQLVVILDDHRVPQGAIIRLTHVKTASRLQQAAEAREALPHLADELPRLAWQVVQRAIEA